MLSFVSKNTEMYEDESRSYKVEKRFVYVKSGTANRKDSSWLWANKTSPGVQPFHLFTLSHNSTLFQDKC